MSKNIYFIRHGESKANAEGIIAGGRVDSPLTEKGRRQALHCASSLPTLDFDLIVSSPMSRTLDTASIILEEIGLDADKIIKCEEFRERNAGEFAGKPKPEYLAADKAGKVKEGESLEELRNRIIKGLEWLKQQEFRNALVVTHNGTIRMIRTIDNDLPASKFTDAPHLENGKYFKIEL